jgi:hypothetical protein
MKRKLLVLICVVAVGVSSATAAAAVQPVNTKVKQVLLHNDGTFGNCAVALTNGPETVLPACRAGWVSLSCDGTYLAKDTSGRFLELTQIALLMNRTMKVYIDDTMRHNGMCVAVRVDLF